MYIKNVTKNDRNRKKDIKKCKKTTQKSNEKWQQKRFENTYKISGNTIHFLQRYYRTGPKRTHKWDKHVSKQVHKSASIGSKKRKKNITKVAKNKQNSSTSTARTIQKKHVFLNNLSVFFSFVCPIFRAVFWCFWCAEWKCVGIGPPDLHRDYEKHIK